MAIIGYARVSHHRPEPQLQLDALRRPEPLASSPTTASAARPRQRPSSTPASITSAKVTSSPYGSSTGSGATPSTSSPSSTN